MQRLKQQTEFRNQSVQGKNKFVFRVWHQSHPILITSLITLATPELAGHILGDVSPPKQHDPGNPNVWAHNWGRKMHQPLPQHQRPGSFCCSDNGGYIPSHYANIPKKQTAWWVYIYIWYMIYDIWYMIYIYFYTYMMYSEARTPITCQQQQ